MRDIFLDQSRGRERLITTFFFVFFYHLFYRQKKIGEINLFR
jgi:hypothetical protein